MCQDCERLHGELQKQAAEMYQLRKAITRLKGELRYERKEKAKLLKDRREQQHYHNGRKRGHHGRNG